MVQDVTEEKEIAAAASNGPISVSDILDHPESEAASSDDFVILPPHIR
jgi:hypothetical protein